MHGVAIDAGSGLDAALRAARGPRAKATDMLTFKRAVLEELGRDASTVLVDAAYGKDLLASYPAGCAKMMAFEADVYHISDEDRITVLPQGLAVEDYPDLDVPQLKFFMYYAPDADPALNARKQDIVADLGTRCRAAGVRFLMEPLVYHPTLEPGTADYAAHKPDMVRRATQVFAAERFNVDVLKVEVPIDLNFVAGFGRDDMSHSAALDAFRVAAQAAGSVDLVYLSAGVSFEWFEASLNLAHEAGVSFAGFMCGRAIWSDAVDIFGASGESGLRDWLADTGRTRLNGLKAAAERG